MAPDPHGGCESLDLHHCPVLLSLVLPRWRARVTCNTLARGVAAGVAGRVSVVVPLLLVQGQGGTRLGTCLLKGGTGARLH